MSSGTLIDVNGQPTYFLVPGTRYLSTLEVEKATRARVRDGRRWETEVAAQGGQGSFSERSYQNP